MQQQQPDVHDTLDVNSAATVSATANQVKTQQRRATAHIPNHDDHIPDVLNYLSKARVKWRHNSDTILIVTKAKDHRLLRYTRCLAEWLIATPRFGKQHPFTVYVDGHLQDAKSFQYQKLCEKDPIFKEKLKFWTPRLCHENPSLFHLIITLGGDGTVLFTSWLFQTVVPPVMSIHLGSLNFLAPFPYTSHREALDELFEGEGFRNTVRMRLSCTVYRHQADKPDTSHESVSEEKRTSVMETAWMKKQLLHEAKRISEAERQCLKKAIPCYTTVPFETYEVLNELVVDRGPSSYMSVLELFGDERHLTTVQADGLVIATPTGSTAYSLSAHGSLTHPDIRAILVTPICPHTLSFRPMLLPETMSIRVVVPFGSSRPAYCSFDGRNRVELKPGDHIKIAMSPYPLPTVCRTESSNDWFSSLQSSLQWNVRQRQKSYVIVESDRQEGKAGDHERQEGEPNSGLFACLQSDDKPSLASLEQTSGEEEEEEEDDDNQTVTADDEEELGVPIWTDEEIRNW
ncbi:ATP-NAD kinase-like domain-containing protein [Zychaea mexicana]|uniref:ATP-NAD kinase-like domain-containing protein n=1 Tax=Zychaea mexicana TaxID=64656 RepID=UPI0022FF2D98|nr:ATP-NAD kinase-like domain-containing protein [Zychaea mexicana]KAI9498918.1 ATP-NAD kinase-like domain-containing protein [Zychaea mexicana]